jgi:hypothetical protein
MSTLSKRRHVAALQISQRPCPFGALWIQIRATVTDRGYKNKLKTPRIYFTIWRRWQSK